MARGRPSDWLPLLLGLAVAVLATAGTPASAAEGDPARAQQVAGWGAQLRQALEAESLTDVEVHGVAVKDKPSRHVEVRQYHLSPGEVRAILGPAARVLEGAGFKLADTHNLATVRVSFTVDVPSICPAESSRFSVISTARNYFYIGCVPRDPTDRGAEDLVRIWSSALDRVLRRAFPRELE